MRISMIALMLALPIATAIGQPPSDRWLLKPVDDRTFAAFKSFYTYDRSLPLDVKLMERDTAGGMSVQHLSFASTPSIRVTARVYSTAIGTSQRRPALVLLHGGVGPGKDAAGMRNVSDYLARAGFLVLNMDLQFFGERASDVLTSFTEAEKHDKLYNQPAAHLAWVMQTIKDAGRAYDLLAGTMDADPKRVAIVGFSRGAVMSTIIGGADPRFAAVVALLGTHFDAQEKAHEAAACPANYIGRIAPRPLFMLNGENDTDHFRNEAVLPLQKLAKDPHEFVWLPIGHSMPRDEYPRVAGWLQAKLR